MLFRRIERLFADVYLNGKRLSKSGTYRSSIGSGAGKARNETFREFLIQTLKNVRCDPFPVAIKKRRRSVLLGLARH